MRTGASAPALPPNGTRVPALELTVKLGTKLLLAPLLTGLIALAGGALNAALMSQEAAQRAQAFHADLQHLRQVTTAQAQAGQIHAGVYRTVALIASLDDKAVQAYRATLRQQITATTQVVQAVASSQPEGSAVRTSVGRIQADLATYGKQADNAVDMASVDPNTGVAAMGNADTSFKAVSQAMADIVAGIEQAALQAADASASQAQRTTAGLLLGSALATLATLAACALMLRKVMRALREAGALATAVADGDLDRADHSDRPDEIGELQRALARMVVQLRDSLLTVQGTAQSLAGSGAEIATGNLDLSQRTEQTACNLQHAAGLLAQLSGAVGHSADAAQQASGLAQAAAQVAQRGGAAVGQVVCTMDAINTASRRIADIVGTIDGIAFQTNILALNAAVEAARAGEQGRGFAVVAGEVRSLAQRSAAAAREIKGLIGSSVEQVNAGTRQVREAGATMTEIVASVQRVESIISEITSASGRQRHDIGQVSQAVSSLDHMTQQNAALVEQSAAAAEQLSDQARSLTNLVTRFRIAA